MITPTNMAFRKKYSCEILLHHAHYIKNNFYITISRRDIYVSLLKRTTLYVCFPRRRNLIQRCICTRVFSKMLLISSRYCAVMTTATSSSAKATSITPSGIISFKSPSYMIFHKSGPSTESWGSPSDPIIL